MCLFAYILLPIPCLSLPLDQPDDRAVSPRRRLYSQPDLRAALAVLARVLADPAYTLPVATCFRRCILRLASALVEARIKLHLPQADSPALTVALVKLLELAPHINK